MRHHIKIPDKRHKDGTIFMRASMNRKVCFSCHGSPWSSHIHQKRERLTVTVSEVNQYSTFPVLFFPITVMWRETRHSGCVNGLPLPSTFLLCEQQRLDDLFPECSVPTGGLFQPNFVQHFFFFQNSRHFGVEASFKLFFSVTVSIP